MRTSTVAGTDAIYNCRLRSTIDRVRLPHAEFRDYSLSLKRLIRSLGDSVEDEAWKGMLTPLRRYGFSVCAAPVPFNEPSILPTDISNLRTKVSVLTSTYPTQVSTLCALLDLLERLLRSSENPYRGCLAEAVKRNGGMGAVLIRDSRLVHAAERQLFQLPATRRLAVVTAPQLMRDRCFDVLYVLGAARWFPAYVFSAPRASRIEVIRYAWLRDKSEPMKTFFSVDTGEPLDLPEPEEHYDAAELLPVVDWKAIRQRVPGIDAHNSLESIEAKLVLLEGDRAVYLESSDGSTVLTVNLDADTTTERIARLSVNELRSGTYVILRTSGGGDYIVTEADLHFLRERASEVRAAQQRWKSLLREEVTRTSLIEVSLQLIEMGSSTADEMNLRNYMSPRSIRTRSPEDFRAIMRVVGLGEEWERYWEMMGEIDNAHRLAGHRIRKQLLKRLAELDLNELERIGHMEMTLPGVDAGSLSAFRIVDVSQTTETAPIQRVGHVWGI